ncbi:MAG: hypothetical protein ABL912_07570 [Novosphingobium sp.]
MYRVTFLNAWLLCGTLDALYATILAAVRGGEMAKVWTGVASGPFGDSANSWGAGGVLTGLSVHFAIMAVMVAVGLWLARKTPLGEVAPWKSGTFYGLVLYGLMYGIVLHARFGVPFPNPDRIKLILGLFPHIFIVGIPIFIFAKRAMNTSARA